MEKIETYLDGMTTDLIGLVPRLVGAAILLWLGSIVVKKVMDFIKKSFNRVKIDESLRPFLISIIGIILKIALYYGAVSIIGINTSGLLAVLAAAGFAIGMALQGSLSNFASGILILVFKPYKIGHWIQIEDKFGKVESIEIFNTIMVTPGEKTMIVPNSQITDKVVTNYSIKGRVRLELEIAMSYEESFPRVKEIILRALKEVSSINQDAILEVGIEQYESHYIVVGVKPFCHPEKYWETTYASYAAIKKAFSDNQIKMAYSEGIELGKIGE